MTPKPEPSYIIAEPDGTTTMSYEPSKTKRVLITRAVYDAKISSYQKYRSWLDEQD